jgi:DNA-directed RNA polymerase subunit RPC12/RpoP
LSWRDKLVKADSNEKEKKDLFKNLRDEFEKNGFNIFVPKSVFSFYTYIDIGGQGLPLIQDRIFPQQVADNHSDSLKFSDEFVKKYVDSFLRSMQFLKGVTSSEGVTVNKNFKKDSKTMEGFDVVGKSGVKYFVRTDRTKQSRCSEVYVGKRKDILCIEMENRTLPIGDNIASLISVLLEDNNPALIGSEESSDEQEPLLEGLRDVVRGGGSYKCILCETENYATVKDTNEDDIFSCKECGVESILTITYEPLMSIYQDDLRLQILNDSGERTFIDDLRGYNSIFNYHGKTVDGVEVDFIKRTQTGYPNSAIQYLTMEKDGDGKIGILGYLSSTEKIEDAKILSDEYGLLVELDKGQIAKGSPIYNAENLRELMPRYKDFSLFTNTTIKGFLQNTYLETGARMSQFLELIHKIHGTAILGLAVETVYDIEPNYDISKIKEDTDMLNLSWDNAVLNGNYELIQGKPDDSAYEFYKQKDLSSKYDLPLIMKWEDYLKKSGDNVDDWESALKSFIADGKKLGIPLSVMELLKLAKEATTSQSEGFETLHRPTFSEEEEEDV